MSLLTDPLGHLPGHLNRHLSTCLGGYLATHLLRYLLALLSLGLNWYLGTCLHIPWLGRHCAWPLTLGLAALLYLSSNWDFLAGLLGNLTALHWGSWRSFGCFTILLCSSLVPCMIALSGIAGWALLAVACLSGCGANLLQRCGAGLYGLLYGLGGALCLIGSLCFGAALGLVAGAALRLLWLWALCLVLSILHPDILHLTSSSSSTITALSTIVLVALLPATGDSNKQADENLQLFGLTDGKRNT